MPAKRKHVTEKMESECQKMDWCMQRFPSLVHVRCVASSNMRHNANEILDSNGPIFMPNSRLLQQMLRFDFDHYQEETSDGKCPMDPSVICVEKGTSIPSELVMWREGVSRFSLQPLGPTEVESEFHIAAYKHIGYVVDYFAELNELLSSFYENSATIMSAQEWIEKHPYKESVPDQNEEVWMKV